MSNTHKLKMVLIGILAAMATSTASDRVQADQKTRLAIVVAKSSPINGLSSHELKRLYLGSVITGPTGSTLIAVNHTKNSGVRLGFEQAVLRMDQDELGRYWIDRRIRGSSGPPKALPSSAHISRAVAANPSAVAYLLVSEVGPGLKAVPIDGKTVNGSDYPVAF